MYYAREDSTLTNGFQTVQAECQGGRRVEPQLYSHIHTESIKFTLGEALFTPFHS